MNPKNIRFTVITCVYNVEDYVDKAIESVLNQDFENYEYIIVNDGSTDNTLEVIKKYNDKRIKIINCEQNKGLSHGRNKAFSEAKGEYILYLDGDDTLYENTTLSKINETIGNEKLDLIYFGVQYVGGSNKKYLPNAENSTKEARITCDIQFSVCSKCWRREFLIEKDIAFIEGIYYEDMIYALKATIFADKIKYGSFPIFCYYRNREGSIMSTPSIKRCTDMYKMLSHLMDLYEITPEQYKPYLLSFIKNETNSVPMRIDAVIRAQKNNENTPIFPKRDYKMIEKI